MKAKDLKKGDVIKYNSRFRVVSSINNTTWKSQTGGNDIPVTELSFSSPVGGGCIYSEDEVRIKCVS